MEKRLQITAGKLELSNSEIELLAMQSLERLSVRWYVKKVESYIARELEEENYKTDLVKLLLCQILPDWFKSYSALVLGSQYPFLLHKVEKSIAKEYNEKAQKFILTHIEEFFKELIVSLDHEYESFVRLSIRQNRLDAGSSHYIDNQI
jgi:hypothetical protein